MKKHILWIICFILMSFSCVWADEAPTELPDVKIIIDNEQKLFTDIPISVNGNTLLPLRQSLAYLGVQNDDQHIIWNQLDKSVTVKHNGMEIYLKVYDDKAKVNGKEITLPAASTIYKGRTYIPVRFVAEALNKKVTWDGKYAAVYIAEAGAYDQVKQVMDKVLAETKQLKDVSYNVSYDLEIKLGGSIPKGMTTTSERHVGSDTIEADLTGDITHYTLGAQTGFAMVEPTALLAEEGYYTKDFSYVRYKGRNWSKSEFTDDTAFTFSSETGSKIPRNSQIALNSLNGLVGDVQYAGMKIGSGAVVGDEVLLEGDIYSDYVIYKILSVIPAGKLGAQATMAVMFGGQMKNAALPTAITIDAKSNTLKKIEFRPQVTYVVEAQQGPLTITLSGKITHDYLQYNKGLKLSVPAEALENASGGALPEDKAASDVISGRSSSEDYEKITDLKTLEQVVGVIGQGRKVGSEAEEYYTWGSVDSGAYIEISFCNGKVRSSGNMNNYQDDKYQKIDLGMTYEQVIAILGEGKKSRTEVTDTYEWVYSDGGTIQIMIKDNKISGSSKF